MQRYKAYLTQITISIIFFFAVASLFITPLAVAYDEAPPWLKQAAAITVPPQDKKIGAIVLHKRVKIIFNEDGKITIITTGAIRILTSEGKSEARAGVSYLTTGEKVKDINAWIIRSSGEVKSLGKDHIIDAALVDNNVYNEIRFKSISGTNYVDPGSVFGYAIEQEERSITSQIQHQFQDDIPVLESSITIELPPNWKAESLAFNHSGIAPSIIGNTYTWELQNLPAIEDEPASPNMRAISPRITVNIFPPPDKPTMIRPFASWKDVSRFTNELSDPQTIYDQAISAKVSELTANSKSEYEKIQAIGRYAQQVNYISIATDMARGGGARPHAAIDVFKKNYGDCKDKANLMRSMLKSIGIESHPVLIYSGDPTYVQEKWPSPLQFNHAIIAVQLSSDIKSNSVITHPALGKLLIFDPTDEFTPVGDLPGHEQGSFALIAAGDKGSLERMPMTDAESNMLERNVEGELSDIGTMTAKVQERSTGQPATKERRALKSLSKSGYIKYIETWISRSATGAAIIKIDPVDDMHNGKFSLDVEFKSPQYAQLMRDRLLMFKPIVVSRRTSLFLTEPSRKFPVIIEGDAFNETIKIKLPAGFTVDELPQSIEITQPFGYYATSSVVKDGVLTFKRSLVLTGGVIPVDQYQSLRKFFVQIRTVENAPVVLVKN